MNETTKILIEALKRFAENPGALENFESYLTYCSDQWLATYASTPAGLAAELDHFSKIDA